MFAVFHAADAGYEADAERWGESDPVNFASGALTEMLGLHTDRPIQETIAALISHRVFERHPRLRVATIELGSRWALELFSRMRSAYAKQPQLFAEDPRVTFREHVWISPHYEDDLLKLRDDLGASHILFGSDWPHPEGLTVPADYSHDVEPFSPDERKLILADNLRVLLGI
jgi:predicted TIM-barrel fold metal-dependent hydrolase